MTIQLKAGWGTIITGYSSLYYLFKVFQYIPSTP